MPCLLEIVLQKLHLIACFRLGPLLPSQALAVQSHGGHEGLISHQIAHVLLLVGITQMLWLLHRRKTKGPGWDSFSRFLWFFLAWSVLVFLGHTLELFLPNDSHIVAGGGVTAFRVDSPQTIIYYVAKLDHLLLVPAIFYLYQALRTWRRAS